MLQMLPAEKPVLKWRGFVKQLIRKMLADGQWHYSGEFAVAVQKNLAVEVLIRAYVAGRACCGRVSYGQDTSVEQLIVSGSRWLACKAANDLCRDRYLVCKGKPGSKQYRLRKRV